MPSWNPEFLSEISYNPTDEELGDITAGPGQPATLGGYAGRFARKWVADPLRGMFRAVDKARTGGFKSQEDMGKAAFEFAGNMVGTPGFGSGLGSGARIAKPWQSRTLDTITGVLPAGKKFPDAATPDSWLSKLKGAGLPKSEVDAAESFLKVANPKDKLSKRHLASALEDVMELPQQGVKVTELGGPEWVAGQKRMEELGHQISQIRRKLEHRERYPLGSPERDDIHTAYAKLLDEQMKLSTDAAGKRPRWPQYNIEGVENPREILYHGKPKSGEPEYINSDMETHYGAEQGKNLIFHQREGELKLPDGKKSTHISEQQSDWHSEYDKSTKKNKEDVFFAEGMDGESYAVGPRRNMEIVGGQHEGYSIGDMTTGIMHENFATRQEAEHYLNLHTGRDTDYAVPEPPMKDTWYKTGFKDAVKRAVEAGHDYVTWDSADTQIRRWPAGEGAEKFFKGHYDEKLVKFAAKEYGVKPEKTYTKEAMLADVPVIPRADRPNTSTVRIDPDYIAVENVPGSRDRYYLRVPDVTSPNSSGFRVDNRIFKSYDEGWAAREEFINQLERFKGPDSGTDEIWRIPITDDMKRKVLLEGQYWSKKDKAATPGGRNAEGIA